MNIRLVVFCISIFVFQIFAAPEAISVSYDYILTFPHQVAIADMIFTGTVVSNLSEYASQFDIEEILWGNATTSKINVRCVEDCEKVSFNVNDKYLVFAFTNNWWTEANKYHEGYVITSEMYLYQFLSPTNRPRDNSIFDDYRIMDPERSAVNFKRIICNGTNYWADTRTFITNFLEISRIKNDEILAYRQIESIIRRKTLSSPLVLPPKLRLELKLYDFLRYRCVEPSQSQSM